MLGLVAHLFQQVGQLSLWSKTLFYQYCALNLGPSQRCNTTDLPIKKSLKSLIYSSTKICVQATFLFSH